MTPLQMHMYYYVKNMLRDNGVSPTYKEIQEEFGLSSISQSYRQIESLIKKGYLKKDGYGNRQLIVTDKHRAEESS